MALIQTRRRFLATLSMAGAAGLLRAPPASAAEGPPETTTVRLAKNPAICQAPNYIADELLRAEGFTDIRYVELPLGGAEPLAPLAHGTVDFDVNYALNFIRAIDAGDPITVLAPLHVGCLELFGNEHIHSITDLKGKSVGVQVLGSDNYAIVALMAAQVGLDPAKDIHWVSDPAAKPKDLFIDGKIDAFLAAPPEPQYLRARNIGRVIVNTAVDHPWSQYFCCMFLGNPDYVRMNPVATKRVLRAVLKAADLCASDPARAARRLVDGGSTAGYDYVLQTLSEVPYDKWREYDAEDTIRWYALRMREAGFTKSTPQKIIAEHTDWRFLNEVKRELKA